MNVRRGVEQWLARRAHNPEVGGSSPPSAITHFLSFLHIRRHSLASHSHTIFRSLYVEGRRFSCKFAGVATRVATQSQAFSRFLNATVLCKWLAHLDRANHLHKTRKFPSDVPGSGVPSTDWHTCQRYNSVWCGSCCHHKRLRDSRYLHIL